MKIYDTQEGVRLQMNRQRIGHWNRWGPFLAERAWGTVREDYSADGKAWDYFPHDHARSRAYRWNEDGLAGICDRHQYLCFALALWNGRDPFLKERLFGLASEEGNHGEDVKEYYFYLDNTPTHSYMKYLYKYPQAEFPYAQLLKENKRRTRQDPEYELIDTGIFDQNRYFDVEIEYVKHEPEDILIRISSPTAAPIQHRFICCPHSGSATRGCGGAIRVGRRSPSAVVVRRTAWPCCSRSIGSWASTFCIVPTRTNCCSPKMRRMWKDCLTLLRLLRMSKMLSTSLL